MNFPPLFSVSREDQLAQPEIIEEVPIEEPIKEVVEYQDPEINAPNQTLYVNRLNEKVVIEDVRQTLYALFSQVGTVIDVIAKRNIMMRGQAFVIMGSLEAAIEAQKQFNNHLLYDRAMKVNFAKEKTDFISKMEGSYLEKEKLPMSDKIKEHKKKIQERRFREMMTQKTSKEVPTISMPLNAQVYVPKDKHKFGNQPNKTLFVEGLQLVDYERLEMLFRNFYGFKEFRGIRPKAVAFVEFEDELKATHCLNELNGTPFEEVSLQISYQKK